MRGLYEHISSSFVLLRFTSIAKHSVSEETLKNYLVIDSVVILEIFREENKIQ